ncbi:MAG: DUF2164 domain-containing protein [Lentisphaerae bacterium]|jgi:uncharacterized protein (DUF2164 family)|nr:DUF2164 domain-containing protein [Lentisphaerota bacterium]
MKIELKEEQKAQLCRTITELYFNDFDEEISTFRAEQILDAFIEKVAPAIYNMALEDVQQFLLKQIDDLDAIYRKE